jgi:hypothetical protein
MTLQSRMSLRDMGQQPTTKIVSAHAIDEFNIGLTEFI